MTIDIATAPEGAIDTPRKTMTQKMRGFTLIELGIVLTIIAILALFAVPRVQGYLIGGKVQPTASETAAAVGVLRALAAANSAAVTQPYVAETGLTILHFATALRDRANALIPTVGSTAATSSVVHRLGATGSLVTMAAATATTAGDAFTLSFATVNGAACADFAAALQVQARAVTIAAGTSAAVAVKAAGGQYNSQLAQTTCATGDVNTLAFTFQ